MIESDYVDQKDKRVQDLGLEEENEMFEAD